MGVRDGVKYAALIQPHVRGAHQALGGRPPFELQTMLRIHCLQLWWNLSDPAMEEELHERPHVPPLRRAYEGAARMPDETTICGFGICWRSTRSPLKSLATMNEGLARQGLMLKPGSVVDATIVAAPSSTKNKDGERDPRCTRRRRATSGTTA